MVGEYAVGVAKGVSQALYGGARGDDKAVGLDNGGSLPDIDNFDDGGTCHLGGGPAIVVRTSVDDGRCGEEAGQCWAF